MLRSASWYTSTCMMTIWNLCTVTLCAIYWPLSVLNNVPCYLVVYVHDTFKENIQNVCAEMPIPAPNSTSSDSWRAGPNDPDLHYCNLYIFFCFLNIVELTDIHRHCVLTLQIAQSTSCGTKSVFEPNSGHTSHCISGTNTPI